MPSIDPELRRPAQHLLRFIDSSPTPWHAAAALVEWLEEEGFSALDERSPWTLAPGGRHYVLRDDSSLIAFIVGTDDPVRAGFRLVGAHTDSPGLRLKPRAPHTADPMLRLGVEIYGGPILATWTDRDLSLAGRVVLRSEPPSVCLVDFGEPLLRLPNLAIHMNRKVNDEGLKLDKQTELPLLLEVLAGELPPQARFRQLLAERLECEPDAIVSWELSVYDTHKGAFWGPAQEFIAAARLDNLASCHAAIRALIAEEETAATRVCALFDHEEVGSESFKGAASSFLRDTLERIGTALGLDGPARQQALAASFLVSADMAHAYHPNFPQGYDGEHKVRVNGGPVIKTNANLRYTTEALSQALFIGWCEEAEVPWQHYVHRTDLPCGSTIGPLTSARLGVRSIDVGNPLWAMHSVRESAGVVDHAWMIRVLERFFACPLLPVSG
ncbi:aspartyl aminopeptidase [Methylomarinovum tepidoasis]|uniref:M18 family aminopeptidase n=1 Tax=Methylomarinovum tepidoasis TaxID=2840183 RepID=A0AAU9C4I9_9GAMM|nr:M18 family aminopeptidase [Methylomarinovum sp. IN45]BCX88054.1 aspartyl aminopeptidase [Methylomarinovum sp. IN45]